jgi:hypothetical protein
MRIPSSALKLEYGVGKTLFCRLVEQNARDPVDNRVERST